MNERQTFTNEELTAFLDGEVDEPMARDIGNALENDAELRARLDGLQIDTGQIKSAFDGLLETAPPVPTTLEEPHTPHSVSRNLSWQAIAATALLCLLIGGGIGTFVSGAKPETWRDYAATYHALYINRTLSQIDQSSKEATAQLAEVSAALGKTIDFAALSQSDQLDYKRAQILGFEGRPLVQLAFLSKVGAPVALCIMRADKAADRNVQVNEMRGMSAASWTTGDFEYLLIGGSDKALIEKAAQLLKARL